MTNSLQWGFGTSNSTHYSMNSHAAARRRPFIDPSALGWFSGSAQKAKALEEADAYCKQRGKQMDVIGESDSGPGGLWQDFIGRSAFRTSRMLWRAVAARYPVTITAVPMTCVSPLANCTTSRTATSPMGESGAWRTNVGSVVSRGIVEEYQAVTAQQGPTSVRSEAAANEAASGRACGRPVPTLCGRWRGPLSGNEIGPR